MINTGENYNFDNHIQALIEKMEPTFEYYLPDEKISQVWQETEVISADYMDFEAVYFEREIEGGLVYISEEFEFFPLYSMYLIQKYGKPSVLLKGILPENDLIGIDAGSEVLILGFANTDVAQKLDEYLPEIDDSTTVDIEYLIQLAMDYIEDII